MAELLSIQEAQQRILERVRPLLSEPVRVERAAGRVLAEAARAAVDLPPFASSAMDGFAVRAADTPGTLPVAFRIAAGRPASRPLAAGEAMGIATGGVVPQGADAVVPVEYVVQYDNDIDIPDPVAPGSNVRPAGGDTRVGDAVVTAGVRLGPAQLGALAAAGIAEVQCARTPRAAVLSTGTELQEPGRPLAPGQVYEANSVMLAAQLEAAGAVVRRLSAVEDSEDAHRAALAAGLEGDVLVTSGGVSVGPHDLVRRVASELGVEEVFWGVAVKPGKPISFGVTESALVFGLPGNPVSSLVGFELFVRPAVLALQGVVDPAPPFEAGTLARAVRRNPARDELVRARAARHDGEVTLDPVSGQDSHMIARAAAADALVLVTRGDGEVPAGARVEYLRLS
jgi:molybdopterin molybdotransferase